MAYIHRAITEILEKRIKSTKCVLVTGARQVGKSTLIKHQYPNFNKANFDDRLTRLQAKEDQNYFFLIILVHFSLMKYKKKVKFLKK